MCVRENKKNSIQHIVLTVFLAFCLTAMNFTPVYAASQQSGGSCDTDYVVQWGDTLYKIGLRYGVSWPDIAANNGIGYPYWVYAGQRICISGAATGTSGGSSGVSVSVTGSIEDKNVSIKTSSLPKNEIFDVLIGTCANTGVNGSIVGKIKTDGAAGSYTGKYKIPPTLDGISCLAVRISSRISSRTAYATFTNGYGSSVQVPAIDFSVKSVVKNKSVKIKITDAVKGKKYKVYIDMGGGGAAGGIYVDSFVAGSSSPFIMTYAIPSKYKGAAKLDLRIEGVNTSGMVYHTFLNKTQ